MTRHTRTNKARPPSVRRAAAEIIRALHRMGNAARARSTRHYFKHEVVALGITTPALRSFATARSRELRSCWDAAEAIQLCERLLREPELEIRGAGFLLLSAFKSELTPELLRQAERWLKRHLDNWALVDGFCGTVLSPLMEQYPDVETRLVQWSRAKSLWLRRAALVTLVPFARRGRRLATAYLLTSRHLGDPEDLMHKATGWLLREAGKTDMPRLKRFLLRHGPAIPRTALRYAVERFPVQERKALLRCTRGSPQRVERKCS